VTGAEPGLRFPSVPHDQVATVVAMLEETLGPSLLGTYLYGSAVEGGLRPDSDVDLFVVIERRLTADERRLIIGGLLPISGRATRRPAWRPIELTIVVDRDVRPWRYPPRMELQYGEWLRSEFLSGNFAPWQADRPDVAILIKMVVAQGEALTGPPAHELLPPVSRADVVRAMVDELPTFIEDLETDTRNVLLTLARMWMTVTNGEVRAKDVAARWAARRVSMEHRELLDRARAGYLGEAEDRWDDVQAVTALADELRESIERSARPLLPADASV
jgi:predicted nucleotidyltransferase